MTGRRIVATVVAAAALTACGTTSEADGGAAGGSTSDSGGNVGIVEDAAAVTQLADAAVLAGSLAEGLAAALPADAREQAAADEGPRAAPCDPAEPDGPHTVTVTRGVAFDPADADAVLDAGRAHLAEIGIEEVRTVGDDGDSPQLVAVFDDQRWQVSLLLGRSAGRGGVRVNTPCLPGDLP